MHLRLLNGAYMYTGDLVHNAALEISIHARSYRAHQLFEEAITHVISLSITNANVRRHH